MHDNSSGACRTFLQAEGRFLKQLSNSFDFDLFYLNFIKEVVGNINLFAGKSETCMRKVSESLCLTQQLFTLLNCIYFHQRSVAVCVASCSCEKR